MSPITGSSPTALEPQPGQDRKIRIDEAVRPSPSVALGSARSSGESVTDSTQLSQFALLLNGLRLLQQTDPAQFRAILSQIGASLSNAAQGASSADNTAAADVVAELSGDFSDAGQKTTSSG